MSVKSNSRASAGQAKRPKTRDDSPPIISIGTAAESLSSSRHEAAERALIGAMLCSQEAIDLTRESLNPDDFALADADAIVRIIFEMRDEGHPVNLLSLDGRLGAAGLLNRVGGSDFLRATIDEGGYLIHSPAVIADAISRVSHFADIRRGEAELATLAKFGTSIADEAGGLNRDPSKPPVDPWESRSEIIDRIELALENLKTSPAKIRKRAVRLSTIEPESTRFLWPGRFVSDDLNSIAGIPSIGKGMMTAYIVSRITRGLPFFDAPDIPVEAGDVLIISAEDNPRTAIVPRLIAAGADRDRVCILEDDDYNTYTLGNIRMLDRYRREMNNLRLVIIDPPAAFLDGVDENANAKVRALCSPLAKWCQKHNIAVLFTTHVPKGRSKNGSGVIMGSMAWNAAPRANWLAAKAEEDGNKGRCILGQIKMNGFKPSPGVYYRVEPVTLEDFICPRTNKPVETGKIVWGDSVDINADDIVSAENDDAGSSGGGRGRKPEESVKGARWLFELLRYGRVPLCELFDRATEDGIRKSRSKTPVYNARERIPQVFPGYTVKPCEKITPTGKSLQAWELDPLPPPVEQSLPPDFSF